MKISDLEKALRLARMEYGDVKVCIKVFDTNNLPKRRLQNVIYGTPVNVVNDPNNTNRFIPDNYIENHPQPFKTQLQRCKVKTVFLLE